MRVSAGFFVTGLSGKRLIHTFPLRRIFLVAAMRAASIWRFVTQPASSAFSPYSPNCTAVCPSTCHGDDRGGAGEYGLKALEAGWVTNRQMRCRSGDEENRRSGKVWMNLFPDKPVTKKPAETRMGSGKGSPEGWVAVVKPGRVMFELAGDEPLAKEALRLAGQKFPSRPSSYAERPISLRARELRALTDDELDRKMAETRRSSSTCTSRRRPACSKTGRLRHAKREIAQS